MRSSFATYLLGISSAIVAASCGGTSSETSVATSVSPLVSDGVAPPAPPYVSTACTAIPGATDCFCADTDMAINGGAFSGSASNRLNASQSGPSFGASQQQWRVSCVDQSTGDRTQCSQPFALCLPGSAPARPRIETSNCVTSTDASDCTCRPDEMAISGGAYAGGGSLNAIQAGGSFGGSPNTWRTSCVNGRGARVACEQPFALCQATPFLISTTCQQESDLSYDCDCTEFGNLAVSGGAYAGLTGMLNSSEVGPQVGLGPQWWHVSCVNREGASVQCQQPFAVCGAF